MMVSELTEKRLALLKEAAPEISRVLELAYLADPIAPLQVKALKEAAPCMSEGSSSEPKVSSLFTAHE